jgi:hypothetical protein
VQALGRTTLILEWLVAAAAYAVLAAVIMWPVLPDPTSRVYGLSGDPLAEVWRLWQFDTGRIGLVGDTVSELANVPSGVPLRRAVDTSQILYDVPASALARALGPVLTYNLLVFAGLWTSALAAFVAMRAMGGALPGAALAGVLFTVSSPHMTEAELHVVLAQVAMLPLLLALGISLINRPSNHRAVALGVILGACGYISAYLLLEAGVLAIGLAVAMAVETARTHQSARQFGLVALTAAITSLVVLTPLLLVLVGHRREVAAAVPTVESDIASYSLGPSDFFDHGSSTYVGLVAAGLAFAGVAFGSASVSTRIALAVVAATGFAVSLRPGVLGDGIPVPAEAIYAAVPYWRVYGRVEIVLSLAIACLAGLLVDRLTAKRARLGLALAGVVAVAAVIDLAKQPPSPAGDLDRPDPIAAWLSGSGGAVAEYPLFGFGNDLVGPYLFRQLTHRRPLLNGSIPRTRGGDLGSAAGDLRSRGLLAPLSLGEVERFVVHPGGGRPNIAGVRSAARFADGTVGYAVNPVEHSVVALFRDAYAREAGPDGSPFQWLTDDSSLRVVSREKSDRFEVRFDTVSYGVPRKVVFGGGSRHVVGTAPTEVRLCVRAGPSGEATLPVTTAPKAQRLPGGDGRAVSIGVFHLSVRRDCP